MDAVTRHLATHHSVISRSEARELGMTARQIDHRAQRVWTRIYPAVYRPADAPHTWLGRARAAALSVDGLISHTAAAAVWGIDGFARARIEVVVAYRRSSVARRGVTVHRSKQMALADPQVRNQLPVTGVARTVLDVAAVVGREKLEFMVDAVLRQKLLEWPDIYAVLVQHSARGRDGCGRLRSLLDVRYGDSAVPDSTFNRMVGNLIAPSVGTARFEYEYNVHTANGVWLARGDLVFPDHRLVIECDSVKHHLNAPSFVKDRRRQNALTTDGWTVLNFTWWDYVNDPRGLLRTVVTALKMKLDD